MLMASPKSAVGVTTEAHVYTAVFFIFCFMPLIYLNLGQGNT